MTSHSPSILLLLSMLAISAQAAGLYTHIQLDGAERITLTRSDGRVEHPAKDRDSGETMEAQTGFGDPKLSPDGEIAGWLSLYPNCCTSYDVAKELVLYRDSRVIQRLRGNGQAIFRWSFSPDSTHVAFCQGPLHFSDYRHYELRKVSDGELVDQTDSGDEHPMGGLPTWAAELDCP